MKTVLCLSTCLLIGQAQAAGYFRSDADLEAIDAALAATRHVNGASFAEGYVAGAADATAGTTWCPAFKAGDEQIQLTVAKYAKDHPELRDRGAATIVGAALATDFPCHKKGEDPL